MRRGVDRITGRVVMRIFLITRIVGVLCGRCKWRANYKARVTLLDEQRVVFLCPHCGRTTQIVGNSKSDIRKQVAERLIRATAHA